jgi:hypothetical protein
VLYLPTCRSSSNQIEYAFVEFKRCAEERPERPSI